MRRHRGSRFAAPNDAGRRRAATRRDVLAGIAVLPVASGCTVIGANGTSPGELFAHGVASGDPAADSVVIWTRISSAAGVSSLDWVAAEDDAFRRVAASGSVPVGPGRDFTAKAVVEGLRPGRRYFYRFMCAAGNSPTGRARTLPVGHLDRIKLAVASCSNYPFGYFNAYDAIGGDESIDFVLHLGDYIYEYGADQWGGDVGEKIGRVHDPLHEIIRLADYRTRHAQYKADQASRRMHAAHTLIPIWDDHESANNPWTGGAENHQPETEGPWSDRRAASIRAYYEWMPIREPVAGQDPAAYWRHYAFGDLASLVTLETRHTGRSRQIEYGDHLGAMRTAADARRFVEQVLGDPRRTMLAVEMQMFFASAIAESVAAGRPWRLVGNQIPIGKVNVPPGASDVIRDGVGADESVQAELAMIEPLARFDLPIYLDTWDGYGAARENLYAAALAAGAGDLLILTGDSHAFWFNELATTAGRRVGYEVGTAGITSPGDFERFGPAAAVELDRLVTAHNPEVLWTHNRKRGHVTVELGRQEADVRYVGMSGVENAVYEAQEIQRVRVTRSGAGLVHEFA